MQPDSFWLGCDPKYIPPNEVQERMNIQSVAFLNSTLKNVDGLEDVLAPSQSTIAGALWEWQVGDAHIVP